METEEPSCSAPATPQSSQSSDDQLPYETDWKRLVARQKQVDYGKNTEGYQRYINQVPRDKRRLYGKNMHPRTPDVTLKTSKRAWDGMVRAWRRYLHTYDPDNQDRASSHDKGVAHPTLHHRVVDSSPGTGFSAVDPTQGSNISVMASQQYGIQSNAAPIATTASSSYQDDAADQPCNCADQSQTLQDAPTSNRMRPPATKPLDQTANEHTHIVPANKAVSKRKPLTNRTNHQDVSSNLMQRCQCQTSKEAAANSRFTRRSDQSSKHCIVPPVPELSLQGKANIASGGSRQPEAAIPGQTFKKPTAAPYKPPILRLPAASAASSSVHKRSDTCFAHDGSACSISIAIGTDKLPSHVSAMILRWQAAKRQTPATVTSACSALEPYHSAKTAAAGCSPQVSRSFCMVCDEEESSVLLTPCQHRALCCHCSLQFRMAAESVFGHVERPCGNLGYCPACQQAVKQHGVYREEQCINGGAIC